MKAGFPVVAVITKPDSPKGRGHTLAQPAVKIFAQKHNITVWQPEKLPDINDRIAELNQPTGVLVSYGKLIPESTLDLFTPGIINVHPSLLPKYRGPSPIETAILTREEETGISIIRLVAAMDAGPIYKQTKVSLRGDETAEQLYADLGERGSRLLISILPSIMDGSSVAHPQDDDNATYCKMIQKSDGAIDWNETARNIEARIRAYHLWPKSRTTLGGVEVIITRGEVIDADNSAPGHVTIHSDELIIGTASGALRIISLKPLGKKEMPVTAFLSGYRDRLSI